MRFLLLFGALLATSVPALANDTSAVLSTGGLEFITNEDIVMESEALFISKDEIRVVYEFRNNGTADQNILVAFPMPDIIPNWWSPVAFPSGPDNNLFEFETTLNGQPVRVTDRFDLKTGILGVGANDRIPAARIGQLQAELAGEGIAQVRYGSGALMLTYVAAGRLVDRVALAAAQALRVLRA